MTQKTPKKLIDELNDEFAKLPKPVTERLCGLARSTLLEINERCPGLVIRIKKYPHAQRGIRLVHLPTLRAYLQSLRENQGANV